MIARSSLALVVLWVLAVPAGAQVTVEPGRSDPRVQSVDYRTDQIVQVEAAVGYALLVEFASDDPIVNVAVGDASAWQVTLSKSGDRLYVQALQAGAPTNMTVISANRRYFFDLVASTSRSAPYAIRFRYPGPRAEQAGLAPAVGAYRLSGARELRPDAISDDGSRTSIKWSAATLLPAVFAVDRNGSETLINGNMRNGIYIIDAVEPRLIFRADDRTARADRVPVHHRRS